jgi:hypothetical protein
MDLTKLQEICKSLAFPKTPLFFKKNSLTATISNYSGLYMAKKPSLKQKVSLMPQTNLIMEKPSFSILT